MRRLIVVVCLLCLAGAAAFPPIAAGADATGEADATGGIEPIVDRTPAVLDEELPGTDDVDADRILLEADVRGDGTAVWTIEYRIDLATAEREEAFESLIEDIRTDESAYLDPFVDRMTGTVETAEAATDRSMAVENASVETDRRELPESTGIVRYQFEWVGFAAVTDGSLVMGDAVAGLFFEADTRFVLRWPDGYELEEIRPEPDDRRDRSAVWNGPIEFGADEPRAVAAQPADAGVPIVLLAGGLLVVAIAASGAVWLLVRRSADDSSADDEADEQPPAANQDESTADHGVPSELLSSEERVLQLLEANGGRMKQKEVAAELDWSAARTSQVVGELREQERVESFRVGRENVLRLLKEDEEPGAPLEPE